MKWLTRLFAKLQSSATRGHPTTRDEAGRPDKPAEAPATEPKTTEPAKSAEPAATGDGRRPRRSTGRRQPGRPGDQHARPRARGRQAAGGGRARRGCRRLPGSPRPPRPRRPSPSRSPRPPSPRRSPHPRSPPRRPAAAEACPRSLKPRQSPLPRHLRPRSLPPRQSPLPQSLPPQSPPLRPSRRLRSPRREAGREARARHVHRGHARRRGDPGRPGKAGCRDSGAPAKPAAAANPGRHGEACCRGNPGGHGKAGRDEGPFGPGSAKPLADGGAPGEEYTVKGKRSSKLFHTAESPYFGRTKADVWFKTPADAESAGFAAWNHKKKAPAK